MSCSLHTLNVGYIGDYIGEYYIGAIKGDTRSLDYSSYNISPYSPLPPEANPELRLRSNSRSQSP